MVSFFLFLKRMDTMLWKTAISTNSTDAFICAGGKSRFKHGGEDDSHLPKWKTNLCMTTVQKGSFFFPSFVLFLICLPNIRMGKKGV